MSDEKLFALCARHHALLLRHDPEIVIAVANSAPDELLSSLRFLSHKKVVVEHWSPAQIERHRAQHHATEPYLPTSGSANNTVVHIEQTLQQALNQRASDIHFEPDTPLFRVRFRIDGVLHTQYQGNADAYPALVARLKVLSDMDIAEKRLPQDGQFTLPDLPGNISFRLATLPCRAGEKIVLRVLHKQDEQLSLDALGLAPRQLDEFKNALNAPQGLILVTGPTGSGKTVSLYSGLNALNQPGINISSVEDPIEIPLSGLNQAQVNLKAGLTFQRVLRALLRQDPDVIMVGEIRDNETAEIAIKAAQTGHLVLSTLHTNSTTDTLVRLEQMGIARWMIASALKLVIAQRLVRKLCPHCRKQHTKPLVLPRTVSRLPLPDWIPVGCEQCYSGFYGRVALFEVLAITPEIHDALLRGDTATQIAELAKQQGCIALLEHGCQAVSRGETTVNELYRVLGLPHGS